MARMEKIRLNKYLSESGICSRRDADGLIENGSVLVNGAKATLGTKIDPDTDAVTLNGKNITKKNATPVYYALYKPTGVVSTADDPQGRKKVTDFVPKEPRVYPVGRLDYDSEGLILLTNDGELTNKLTHPSFEHEKEYNVECKIQNSEVKSTNQNLELYKTKLERGFDVDGQFMQMDSVEIGKLNSYNLILTAVMHTGYNRQIRKMCAKIGLEVHRLIRTRIAKLRLESLGLKPGEYKIVNKENIL